MKITHHFPQEQYGFSEIEYDTAGTYDLEMMETHLSTYHALKASVTTQDAPGQGLGLPNKEWLKVVEHYLNTAQLLGDAETWEKLNKYQRDWIQETKRALKRLKAKEE